MRFLSRFWEAVQQMWRTIWGEDMPAEEAAAQAGKANAECAENGALLHFRGRRLFLHRFSLVLGSIAGALVTIPFVGFLFAARRDVPETAWRMIGTLEEFPVGETVRVTFLDPAPLPWAGFSARTAAWVRRNENDEFLALSVYCTHVGCPIRWLENARLFMCPCHGGSFYSDGSVAGGPPPAPLDRYAVRVQNGQVEILAQPLPLPT